MTDEGVDKMKSKTMKDVREGMDTDGDGEISFEEFKAYMMTRKNRQSKLKAIVTYVGDKAIDMFVVGLAIVSMYFFGVSVI